ncbi:MAG TPA: hypothetical protein VME69_17075 [Methylocella sp.]|nr:hypothetical protein [Methylocella sp.]
MLREEVLSAAGTGALEKWDADLNRRFHPRMEMTREGLRLGAETPLAKVKEDGSAHRELMLDGRHALALLATAYDPHCQRGGLASRRSAYHGGAGFLRVSNISRVLRRE